jgi:hypothetical protein
LYIAFPFLSFPLHFIPSSFDTTCFYYSCNISLNFSFEYNFIYFAGKIVTDCAIEISHETEFGPCFEPCCADQQSYRHGRRYTNHLNLYPPRVFPFFAIALSAMASSPPDHNKSVLPMVQSPPSFHVQRKGSLPTNRKTQRSNSRSNSDQAQTQRSPFIPSRIASVHSQPAQRSLSTDDGYSNHTMVAKPFTAQHDPKRLLNVVTSVVKTRSGSVLSRNTILKMDHFPSGTYEALLWTWVVHTLTIY